MSLRRLRLLLLCGLGTLSTLSVFGSFLYQIYGGVPKPAPLATPAAAWARSFCLAGLSRLQREYDEQAAGRLLADGRGMASQSTWLGFVGGWETRLQATLDHCQSVPDAAAHAAATAVHQWAAHQASAAAAQGAAQTQRLRLRQILATQP